MAIQSVFDFSRGDIFTSGNDNVFAPVHNSQSLLRVQRGEVPRVEPAVTNGSTCGFRILVVAGHDHIAAHSNLADFLIVESHISFIRVNDPNLRTEYFDSRKTMM